MAVPTAPLAVIERAESALRLRADFRRPSQAPMPYNFDCINTMSGSRHMQRFRLYFVPLASAIFLSACIIQPGKPLPPADAVPILKIKIPARFEPIELTADTLRSEVQKCVTTESPDASLPVNVTANFPDDTVTHVFSHPGSASQFVLSGSTGLCLRKSVTGYPIFAAEAFINTISPIGIPADVQEGWNQKLATIIAIQGKARVAYVFNNGAGIVARYWVETRPFHVLHYVSEGFKKKEVLELESLDERFSHPALRGVSTTNRSVPLSKQPGANSKSRLLSHRTETLPDMPPALKP